MKQVAKEVNVLEYAGGTQRHRVDRDKGVIYGVKIIGHTASDGRRYSSGALSGAVPLYEGARVNVNHPSAVRPGEDRSFYDWFGTLQNVTESRDGLHGDLHYLKTHAVANRVAEAAERFPDKFGLSHNAVVMESQVDGQTVYHSINRVRSVDLVCRPGTTRGIFESERTPHMDPNGSMDPIDNVEIVEAPVLDSDGMTWQMFVDQAHEIFSGEGESAEKASKIGKLAKTLLKVQDQIEEVLTGDVETPAEETPAEEEVTESARELNRLRRRNAARDVLESEGIPYGPSRETQIKALAALNSQADRKALAKTWKGIATKPKSTPASVLESQRDGSQKQPAAYDDPKRAAAALMGRG